jgi:MFS family permease
MARDFKRTSPEGSLWSRQQLLALAALIGCLSTYGITISLFTPLLSLILESRGASATLIGALAMAGPVGVMLGSFVIPRFMRQIEGRKLLLAGVVIEIVLIVALMSTDSVFAWFVIRFLGGLTGVVLFVVTETWMIEITPEPHRGRVMGLYNTTLALSFALGPLILSMTGVEGKTPFVAGIILMALAGLPLLFAGTYRPSSAEEPGFGIVSFIRVAPLLALACFVVAFKDLAGVSLLPVYGLRVGLDESSAVLMLFFASIGGALLQLPIGWAADYFDARKVLVVCAFVGVFGALIWPFVVGVPVLLWMTLFLWWGFFAGAYTVAMILAGQWFKGVELATAMAAFGVYWGMGAFAGPLIGGVSMDLWNPHGLALTLVIVAGGFFAVSLLRRLYHPRLDRLVG